jgi:oxalate decarboxylase
VFSKPKPLRSQESTLTGATMLLKPGALREMHWHPNADEWQFYLSGRARITLFGAHGRTKTETFGPGEVAFIKQGFGHFVEQVGDEPTKLLILFKSPVYEEINLSTWLAANPLDIIADNFGISRELADRLPKKSIVIAAPQAGLSSST